MADNAGIIQQGTDLFGRVADDFFSIETIKNGAKMIALPKDRDPRQACLKAVQHKLFEQSAVIIFGDAPILIVIGDIERINARPRAANFTVRMFYDALHAWLAPSRIACGIHSGRRMRSGRPPADRGSPAAIAS